MLLVPDGLFVDSETETVFWTDSGHNNIEAMQFDGSNRRELVTGLGEPRDIMVLPSNRWVEEKEDTSTPDSVLQNIIQ